MLQKEDDWVKKCMEYEAEGPRPRGRPKRTWREVVEKDCQACKLNKEDDTEEDDTVDCSRLMGTHAHTHAHTHTHTHTPV